MRGGVCISVTYSKNGNERAHRTEMTASKIHNAHAKSIAKLPQAGTHTKQNMLMIVARPSGKAPRNIDCTGWRRAALNVSGYMIYRIILRMQPPIKRTTLRAKMIMEIHCSHWPL